MKNVLCFNSTLPSTYNYLRPYDLMGDFLLPTLALGSPCSFIQCIPLVLVILFLDSTIRRRGLDTIFSLWGDSLTLWNLKLHLEQCYCLELYPDNIQPFTVCTELIFMNSWSVFCLQESICIIKDVWFVVLYDCCFGGCHFLFYIYALPVHLGMHLCGN